ncbi:tyrosine-type recombinase/integrase [Subtercola boreus]|nr:site-specific integrase [Subtercola boreus]TQL55051.1 site-specific recombinase XerD [Subtercola boreus]
MDDSGRAVQVSGTAASKEQAIERRENNLRKRLVKSGELPLSALSARPKELKLTTGEMLNEWLEVKRQKTSKAERVSANTAHVYENQIRLHIAPYVGSIPVRLITEEDIRNLLFRTLPKKMKTKKVDGKDVATNVPLLGASQLRLIQGIINQGFRYATEQGHVLENPTTRIDQLDKPDSRSETEHLEKKNWIAREIAAYTQGTAEEAHWIFALMGLRQSERLGLTWDCFTYLDDSRGKQPVVEIRQQLSRDAKTGTMSIKPQPKTNAGKRIIPLSPRVVDVLKRHRAEQRQIKQDEGWSTEPQFANLVYTTENGSPIRQTTDNKRWNSLLSDEKKLNLKPEYRIRQHALRHIAITLLITHGTPIEIVRAIAGHHSEAITRGTYSHIDTAPKVQPMNDLMDDIYRTADKRAARKTQ